MAKLRIKSVLVHKTFKISELEDKKVMEYAKLLGESFSTFNRRALEMRCRAVDVVRNPSLLAQALREIAHMNERNH